MGQQQQIIYVEGKGFIPIQSGQSVQDAIATATPERTAGAGVGNLGVNSPDGQFFGISQPPLPQDDAENILKTFPQLAGLLAQFTPIGKMGVTGAVAVPSAVELLRQVLQGESLDPMEIAGQGAAGAFGHGVGRGLEKIGESGVAAVRKALNLKSGKFAYDEVAEQGIPRTLIDEKAKMTIPGVAKLAGKADATGNPWTQDAVDALRKSRFDADNTTKTPGGFMSMIAEYLQHPPRAMARGSAMAAPFGVDTAKAAPTVEALVRALMAAISGTRGEPEAPPVSGPQRRISP